MRLDFKGHRLFMIFKIQFYLHSLIKKCYQTFLNRRTWLCSWFTEFWKAIISIIVKWYLRLPSKLENDCSLLGNWMDVKNLTLLITFLTKFFQKMFKEDGTTWEIKVNEGKKNIFHLQTKTISVFLKNFKYQLVIIIG